MTPQISERPCVINIKRLSVNVSQKLCSRRQELLRPLASRRFVELEEAWSQNIGTPAGKHFLEPYLDSWF